LLSNSEKEATR